MSSITILDGGFSTQLSTHVGDKIDGHPLWTARFLASDPKAIFQTHLDFLRAGADIIETNTYQASIDGFVQYLGLDKFESLELISKAVDLAKEATKVYLAEIKDKTGIPNKNPLIAGSCGPYGASLHDGSEYTGEYASSISKEFLKAWHRPRIEVLINAGVDILALETIPCEIEAEALVELIKEYPNIKAWLSFSCKTDGMSIVDGSNFQSVALKCYKNSTPGQLIAVGVNCLAPTAVTSLIQNFNKMGEISVPLIVYPNSGEVYTVAEGWKQRGSEPPLENFIDEWLNYGVKFIGGCCRTYAHDVRKILFEVRNWEKKKSDGIPCCCGE
ncbi:homocysteine S-methyltransferase-like [Chelonus insularis]|uniref:homocysteine S-methyltransferase-like n=1 Tax=Chelonus insularis TaxID=460826 RepID=UPI00158B8B46|nr:homocysteine S-methyltransferase-like [Chelonus insularis]